MHTVRVTVLSRIRVENPLHVECSECGIIAAETNYTDALRIRQTHIDSHAAETDQRVWTATNV